MLSLIILDFDEFLNKKEKLTNMKVTGEHYRQNPLLQEGLEVPCEISVRMSAYIVNHTLLQDCEILLRELYTEPKEDEVMGTFLSGPEADVINFFVQPHQIINRKNQKPAAIKSKDIKHIFIAIEQQKKPSNMIVIE